MNPDLAAHRDFRRFAPQDLIIVLSCTRINAVTSGFLLDALINYGHTNFSRRATSMLIRISSPS